MPLTKRSAGTATASAILAATLALTLSATAVGVPTVPVTADTSTSPSNGSYDWSVTKSAQPGGTVNTSDDTTTVTYTVTATRTARAGSTWSVSGETSLHNETNSPVRDITADVSANGATCDTASGGAVGTLYPGQRAAVGYTCSWDTDPGAGPHTITTNLRSYDGQRSYDTSFAFTPGAVDVTDSFNGGPYEPLEGGTGLTESRTFTYQRTLVTPASSCLTYGNRVRLVGEDAPPPKGPKSALKTKKGESSGKKGDAPKKGSKEPKSKDDKTPKGTSSERTANTAVTVCRTPKPLLSTQEIVPPSGNVAGATPVKKPRVKPRTKLRITKRGPKRARAGALVRYRITVSTRGKVGARNVRVRDILPKGMVLAKRQRGLSQKGRYLIWTARGINRKRSLTRIVTLRVLKGTVGTRCNRADAVASNAPRVRTRSCTRIVQPKSKPVTPAVLG